MSHLIWECVSCHQTIQDGWGHSESCPDHFEAHTFRLEKEIDRLTEILERHEERLRQLERVTF